MPSKALGRRIPPDWNHVERFPLRTVQRESVLSVNDVLRLPRYRERYNQGSEGACVGFASSWMMSVLNHRFYDARWLWEQAKTVDEFPDTNPGDNHGTSVRAAMDVLRDKGHCTIYRDKTRPPDRTEGIVENRWATTVDEVRTCIAQGTPVVIGVNWYDNFDRPQRSGRREYWIGKGDLGSVRGGHAVCVYGANDDKQAVRITNSWGRSYPLVWMPYEVLSRLLAEEGEATVIVDR